MARRSVGAGWNRVLSNKWMTPLGFYPFFLFLDGSRAPCWGSGATTTSERLLKPVQVASNDGVTLIAL